MKKVLILIASFILIAGCASQSEQQKENMKEFLATFLEDSCSTILTRSYNDEKECVEVSYESKKWDVWNSISVSYDVTGKDVLGVRLKEPKVCHFSLGVWFIKRGATNVMSLEVKTRDKKYSIVPILVQPMSDISGYFLAYFDFNDNSAQECLKHLSLSYDYVEMGIRTDKGMFTIPLSEIYIIQYMARTYREDGGKFE